MKITTECKHCERKFTFDVPKDYINYPAGTILSIIQCFRCRKLTKIVHTGNGKWKIKKATRKDLKKFFDEV